MTEGNPFLCVTTPSQRDCVISEYSLPVSKYKYPHRGALLTVPLPRSGKNSSSQEEVIKTAATRFSFLVQKGELTPGHPIIVYITKFEVNLVELCQNWLTSHKTTLLKVCSGIMTNSLFLYLLHYEECKGTTHLG